MRLFPYLAFSSLTLLLLAGACTTSRYYTPNTMQVPMLGGAGEGTVSAGFTKDGDDSGYEFQGIYSPLPHLGLMVQHFNLRYEGTTYADFTSSFSASPYKGHSRLTEAGLGGYMSVGPQKEYLISLFGGYGQGRTENRYSPPLDMPGTETYNSHWSYQRFFVQPALGMKYRRFQVGTGLRFAWVNFYDGVINSRVGILETQRIELLEGTSPLFLTEMVWTIGWRLRPVVIKVNSTGVVRGKKSIQELDLASNYVSLTVGLDLHEIKWRK